MQVIEETIAQLETIVVNPTKGTPAIVLLHGYGANFRDLFPLYQVICPPTPCTFYFPNGPEKVFTGMPEYGRAWFPLDAERLAALAAKQAYDEVAAMDYNGMSEMTDTVVAFLKEIRVDHPNIILGGFSQGAILSTNVALATDADLRGLVLLSASLAKKKHWQKGAEQRKDLPVFQSHGQYDPVLPFALAQQLRDLLQAAGLSVAFHDFPGMHEIPMPVVETCRSFLDQLTTSLGE